MTLKWHTSEDGLQAKAGSVTYLISAAWALPNVRKWDVYITHPEMPRDEDGMTVLLYRGWGHNVDDAKVLAQLICDAPLGDDSARMEWMRRHHRELVDEVTK